jgi:plastocyanin
VSRFRLLTAIAVVTAVALVALAGIAGARGSTSIKVGDDFFSPTSKTVSSGTKVKFKWIGEDKHNVVKKKGPGGGFGSGLTDAPGVNFTKKFKKRGTYKLICTVHEEMKMKLKVQ